MKITRRFSALTLALLALAAFTLAFSPSTAYYAQILRNVDIQAEFDREHRTW